MIEDEAYPEVVEPKASGKGRGKGGQRQKGRGIRPGGRYRVNP